MTTIIWGPHHLLSALTKSLSGIPSCPTTRMSRSNIFRAGTKFATPPGVEAPGRESKSLRARVGLIQPRADLPCSGGALVPHLCRPGVETVDCRGRLRSTKRAEKRNGFVKSCSKISPEKIVRRRTQIRSIYHYTLTRVTVQAGPDWWRAQQVGGCGGGPPIPSLVVAGVGHWRSQIRPEEEKVGLRGHPSSSPGFAAQARLVITHISMSVS